nr:hypothetical protein [Angustibacter aerolatus]
MGRGGPGAARVPRGDLPGRPGRPRPGRRRRRRGGRARGQRRPARRGARRDPLRRGRRRARGHARRRPGLVHAVVGPRPDLLVVGDPDATTLGFRGADPGLLLADPPSGPASTVVLGSSWRQGRVLRAVTGRVAARVGAVGGGRQRAAAPPAGAPAGERVVHVVRSVAHETAVVAEPAAPQARAGGCPGPTWPCSSAAGLARRPCGGVSTRRGCRSTCRSPSLPVRDQPAVVPLLDAFEIALDLASGRDEPLPPGRAEQPAAVAARRHRRDGPAPAAAGAARRRAGRWRRSAERRACSTRPCSMPRGWARSSPARGHRLGAWRGCWRPA